MRFLLAAAFATSLLAQSGLDRPLFGTMLGARGTVRPLYGIAGGLIPGEPIAKRVFSMACSSRECLMKTGAAILSATGSVSAPSGEALFGLDGDSALIYFPEGRTLERWHDDRLAPVAWISRGEVLSIRVVSGGAFEAALRRGERVWIERFSRDGERLGLTGFLPPATSAVMLLDRGVLFALRSALMLERPDGTAMRFDVSGARSIFPIGDGMVEVVAPGARYALRVEPGRERMIVLPSLRTEAQ